MSTEIQKTNQMSVSEIMTMAKTFAESGMFTDTKQMAQAFVKIQAGQEIGIPPFSAMSGIHIIQGKPTLGAGLIASSVKGSGKYDYKVKEMSEKICSIDFFQGKENIGNSTFTIEDAKKAGTKNIDKFPKNMLFARAISNGVKWFCPDVFSGPVYVPEEMPEPETHDVPHVEVKEPATEIKKPALPKSGAKFESAAEYIKGYDGSFFDALDVIKKKYEVSEDLEGLLVNRVSELAGEEENV